MEHVRLRPSPRYQVRHLGLDQAAYEPCRTIATLDRDASVGSSCNDMSYQLVQIRDISIDAKVSVLMPECSSQYPAECCMESWSTRNGKGSTRCTKNQMHASSCEDQHRSDWFSHSFMHAIRGATTPWLHICLVRAACPTYIGPFNCDG